MKRALLSMLALTLVVVACSDQMTPAQPDTEPQMAMVPVSVAAAPAISTLTITVSASDITTDLVFNVTMTNGEATDTITIPAGSDRTITVRGYDASNIETHRGSKTVSLTEGLNAQLTVVLSSLSGDQPLVVALGETTVTVSPQTATVSVGGTTQLAAVVTDEAGDTLDVSVRWASSHPAVATVDDAGLVTGVSVGSASIIATYGGVGASAAITVPESAFPTEGLVAWYPFNGNANDASGNGHDGFNAGAVGSLDRRGDTGGALSFDGVDDYIRVASLDALQFRPITYTAWISIDALLPLSDFCSGVVCALNGTETARVILGRDQGCNGAQGALTLHHNPSLGIVNELLYYRGGDAVRSETSPTAADWVHLGLTIGADGTHTFYLDATAVRSANASLVEAGPIGFYIGSGEYGCGASSGTLRYQWKGSLDDVGIWNRALTPEEIAYLANN